MELPLVSIGIPTYNRPEGLKKVIACVTNQTYPNLEIIISDNASGNKFVDDVVNGYLALDKRIKFFQQKTAISPLANFTFVLNQATGKYFMWAADDDEFSSITIEQSLHAFLQNEHVVLSSLGCQVINTTDRSARKLNFVPHTVDSDYMAKYRKVIDYMFYEINVYFFALIRLDVLRKCKFYKSNVYGSDVFLLLELLAFGDIAINNDYIGITYYLHPEQASSSMKKIVQSNKKNLSFWERKFFFSKYIFYYLKIINRSKKLKLTEKASLSFYSLKKWFSTNKYHLVKYDLGLNSIIQKLKKDSR